MDSVTNKTRLAEKRYRDKLKKEYELNREKKSKMKEDKKEKTW